VSSAVPAAAMVLAAGLGKRMLPLTDRRPKPLIPVAGKALVDWSLDSLERAGVARAVVNVHYLADQVIAHLAGRTRPEIVISDERDGLLDSGGGIVRALPALGRDPFFVVNADTFWIDGSTPNLDRLALAWDAGRMDILLMLTDHESATGHSGASDFFITADGTLERARGRPDGLIYAGAAIVAPALFDDAPAGAHSLNRHFDRAMAAGRLRGMVMDGRWITVGTPAAIPLAEAAVAAALAERR